MTSIGVFQIAVFSGVLLLLTKPLGLFMARLFQGERTFLHPILRPVESLIYKLCGIREEAEQRWTQYTAGLLWFSVFAFLFVYVFQRLQGLLPLNPQGFGGKLVSPDLAYNTAVSFVTNTNWQAYSGESTLSYFVQMVALTVHNFVSAAVGHRRSDGHYTRLCPPSDRQDRQLLGRPHARDTVCAAADCSDRRTAALLPGRHSELPPLHHRQDPRRSHPDYSAGSRRLAGSHQDAGDQRRRVLQCQLRASL